jgi:hypothetical protein
VASGHQMKVIMSCSVLTVQHAGSCALETSTYTTTFTVVLVMYSCKSTVQSCPCNVFRCCLNGSQRTPSPVHTAANACQGLLVAAVQGVVKGDQQNAAAFRSVPCLCLCRPPFKAAIYSVILERGILLQLWRRYSYLRHELGVFQVIYHS